MNKIKQMREKLGWSRAKFCREFGIPIRTVEDWDNESISSYPKSWVEKLILEKLGEIGMKKMNLYFFKEINKFYEGRTFLPKRLDKMFYDKTDEEVLNLKFSIDDAIVIANRALEFEREMFDNQYERQYEYLDADLKLKRKYFELFNKEAMDLKTIDMIVDMVISCGGDDLIITINLKKKIKENVK
jgi:transcriptional regulator with XRE-family HTH domain